MLNRLLVVRASGQAEGVAQLCTSGGLEQIVGLVLDLGSLRQAFAKGMEMVTR
jgi:hypothetical protein